MPKKTKRKKIVKYLPVVALLLVAALAILEVTNVTNFIGKKSSGSQENVNGSSANSPTNNIDYGPANPEDNVPVPDKTTKPNDATPNTTNTNSKISVVITRSGVSIEGGYYFIKAVISGSTNATCTAKMTKGSLSATATSPAAIIEGQYSCSNLKIPLSQFLENGTWALEVTAKDANGTTATDSTEAPINI